MALLMTCPGCGNQIANNGEDCPFCGYIVKEGRPKEEPEDELPDENEMPAEEKETETVNKQIDKPVEVSVSEAATNPVTTEQSSQPQTSTQQDNNNIFNQFKQKANYTAQKQGQFQPEGNYVITSEQTTTVPFPTQDSSALPPMAKEQPVAPAQLYNAPAVHLDPLKGEQVNNQLPPITLEKAVYAEQIRHTAPVKLTPIEEDKVTDGLPPIQLTGAQISTPVTQAQQPVYQSVSQMPQTQWSRNPQDTAQPVQQVPVQQTPVQQAPVQQVPVQQAPVQQVPVQQVPVQQAPVQQVPVQQTPVQQAPVQQVPVQQIPVQQAPVQQVPVQQAPVQQAPVQQVPVQQAPVQQAPVQQVPVQQIPVQQAPVQQVPVQQASVQQAPVQKVPVQKQWSRNPQDFADTAQSVQQVPVQQAPVQQASVQKAPVQKQWSKNPQDFATDGSASETVNGRKTKLQPLELSPDDRNPTGEKLENLQYDEVNTLGGDDSFDEDGYVRQLKQQIKNGSIESSEQVNVRSAYETPKDFEEKPLKFDGREMKSGVNVVRIPKQSNRAKFAILIPILLAIALCIIAFIMVMNFFDSSNEENSTDESSVSSAVASVDSWGANIDEVLNIDYTEI